MKKSVILLSVVFVFLIVISSCDSGSGYDGGNNNPDKIHIQVSVIREPAPSTTYATVAGEIEKNNESLSGAIITVAGELSLQSEGNEIYLNQYLPVPAEGTSVPFSVTYEGVTYSDTLVMPSSINVTYPTTRTIVTSPTEITVTWDTAPLPYTPEYVDVGGGFTSEGEYYSKIVPFSQGYCTLPVNPVNWPSGSRRPVYISACNKVYLIDKILTDDSYFYISNGTSILVKIQ